MKWIDFFMWSAFFYALYYAINIVIDVGKGMRTDSVVAGDNVLHFTEHVAAADAAAEIPPEEPAKPPVQKTPAIQAPSLPPAPPAKQITPENPIEGQGVTIKELCELAQMDAFEYFKNVSFPS